jgi:hypothetical protein
MRERKVESNDVKQFINRKLNDIENVFMIAIPLYDFFHQTLDIFNIDGVKS